LRNAHIGWFRRISEGNKYIALLGRLRHQLLCWSTR
jgi:hypothetical protein